MTCVGFCDCYPGTPALPLEVVGDNYQTAGTSLAKLAGITVVVLLIQGLFNWSKKRRSTHPSLA